MINCSQFGTGTGRGEGGGQMAIPPPPAFEIGGGGGMAHPPLNKKSYFFLLVDWFTGRWRACLDLSPSLGFLHDPKMGNRVLPPPFTTFSVRYQRTILGKNYFLACQLVAERWEDVLYCSVLGFFFSRLKKMYRSTPPPSTFQRRPAMKLWPRPTHFQICSATWFAE